MSNLERRSFMKSSATAIAVAAAAVASGASAGAPAAKGKWNSSGSDKSNRGGVPDRFLTKDSLIMLVDHQTGTIGWVKSIPVAAVTANCRVLTRMATTYEMPLVITTTMEQNVGPTISDIRDLDPEAYAHRFARGGQLSCWDDDRLATTVSSLKRPNLILAGLTTDICLFWAARDAVKRGYRVMVVADACGTMTPLGDQLTYARLRDLGVVVADTNQVVTELVNNFGTPEGQKAQKIMAEEIISKLAP